MPEPFLISPYFLDYVLPFVLVFTVVFAVLQKTKLLGDEAKQINAIIGLVVGLFLIAFPGPRGIVVLLMPFLAVVLVILLVFMLLYGFIVSKEDGDILGKWWKVAFGALLTIGLISFLLVITGYINVVNDFLFNVGGGQVWINLLLVIVIVGAIIAVVRGEGKSSP